MSIPAQGDLEDLERIEAKGPFVAHSARFLIEARKPRRSA